MTTGPNGIGTVESAGDPEDATDSQDSHNQTFDELLQRFPSQQTKLEQRAREFFLHHNRSVAKDGQGRDQRFIHKGKLEPEKKDDDHGYISEDDCIAVLYDMTKGPAKKHRKYQVFYGNVAKLTYDKGGKTVPGPRAHIKDETGVSACKWFDEKMGDNGKPVTYHGRRAFYLTLNNTAGFNDNVEFANILAGVPMTFDKDNDCWLLNPTDSEYAEKQMQRFSKYHNSTPAQQAKQGEWNKDVRVGHDSMKTKVCVELGIDF